MQVIAAGILSKVEYSQRGLFKDPSLRRLLLAVESSCISMLLQRVFHDSLKVNERFLSFDRLWETYKTESAMPDNGFVYTYAKVDEALIPTLKALSIQAYKAVQGSGYGRIDIRQDAVSGELYVLEVNAQCGLSEDENYTSIGAILRFEDLNFAALTEAILEDAIRTHCEKRERLAQGEYQDQ